MKNYFLVNPMAGTGKGIEQFCEKIKKACEARAADYEIYLTRAIGDATDFVRDICASGGAPARFFACGGDGTLCEVANGAMGAVGTEIGLFPIGTGNDFARNFSEKHLFFDFDAQLDGVAQSFDALTYNGSFAANMINIGFDCEVVKKKEKLQEKKYLPAKLAYIFGLIICFARKPGMKAEIFVDGERIDETEFLLSTYANGCFCGGGFMSNPHASLTDGKIDALFVKNISRMKFASLVGSYKSGTHLVPKNEKLLFSKKAESILLKFPKIQSICVDGELFECEELLIECIKRGLNFIVPKGASLIKRSDVAEAEPVGV